MPAFVRKPMALLAGVMVLLGTPAALYAVGSAITTVLVHTPLPSISSSSGAAAVPKPAASSVPAKIKVGMNLNTLSYYTSESPLLNRAKLGSTWVVRGQTTDPSMLNSDGYPIAIPANGVFWETNVGLDPASGTPYTQTYLLRWKGTGSVDVGLTGPTTVGDHQITFQNIYGCVLINIRATSPTDPVREVSVVRQDQVADYDAGKVFNQTFIDRSVKPFTTFRTMDWDLINNSQEANWSDRQKLTDATWTRMPLELEVALANQNNVDLWKTIPALATDDYVRQMLAYIKANLSPTLKLHLEYSNEIWNGGFTQNAWAAQQAQTRWGVTNWGASTFYGYRSAQIASIAWSIFGTNSTQLKPVIGGWSGWIGPEPTDAVANGVVRAGVGTLNNLFREYAIAPYFGDALGAGPGNEADRAIVLSWANDPTPQGLNNAFQQLEHGGLLKMTGTSLDEAKLVYEPKHSAWAKKYNLSLVAYEGGLSFYYFMADPATKPTLLAFFNRMLADPRMGTLYTRWVNDFAGNGGTLIENYNDVGPISEFGPWGSLPSIYSPDTPRYLALKAINTL